MIKIIDVHKNFGEHTVLKGVHLEIKKGQIVALIGGSGKGKSVLLKSVIGLLKPDSGQVLIHQQDISRLSGKKLKKIKEQLGIVFQSAALFDSLTVFENIAFPLKEKTKLSFSQIKEKVAQELANVDLKGCEEKYPAQLSGGMKKRVALARCLVMDPEAILFDEPTTGLDPIITNTIHQLIKRLQQKRNLTALIVSHEIPTIFNIVDKVAMLHEGEILSVGTPEEFIASDNPTIRRFLKGEIE